MGHFDVLNFIFYKKKLMEIMKFFFIFFLFRSNPIREYFFHQNRCTRKYFLGGVQKLALGCTKVEGGQGGGRGGL